MDFKKINQGIETNVDSFKDSLKKFLIENEMIVVGSDKLNTPEGQKSNELLTLINDYKPITLNANDFKKRKRGKNIVPQHERCTACISNGDQCSRRKKNNEKFCGTHIKGKPHGVISTQRKVTNQKKVNIHTQDIQGILYWIDDDGNVYDPKQILSNHNSPRIIAKYKNNEGKYHIEKFL